MALPLLAFAASLLFCGPIQPTVAYYHGSSTHHEIHLAGDPADLLDEIHQEIKEMKAAYDKGDRDEAIAGIKAILLEDGATVGFVEDGHSVKPLKRALDAWREAVPDSPFKVAPEGQDPDVKVLFVDRVKGVEAEESDPDAQGQVSYSRPDEEADGRLHAEILVCTIVDGRDMTPDEETAVIAHELGHLFGLNDSPDGQGLMGEFDPKDVLTGPTDRDAKAVRMLRQELRDTLASWQR
jgi:hypothetical protein